MRCAPAAWRAPAATPALLLAAAFLASCGGGGGGGSSPAFVPVATIPPSSQFQGLLLQSATAGGALATDWNAASCTDNRQKNWVRSFLNESYLFYREAPLTTIDPNTYSGTVQNLFAAYTTNGVPNNKDRFSFVLTQAEADGIFASGVPTDVGFEVRRDRNYPDAFGNGIIRIAYIDPGSNAAAAGFRRGQVIASVNGVGTAYGTTQAQVDLLNSMFGSPAGTTFNVGVQDSVGAPIHYLTAIATAYSSSPLITSFIAPASGASPAIGYLAFGSFATPIGEVQLADTFKSFAAAGVTALVVDLRYNGGGYVDIASQLGFMVAGQIRTANRPFETLVYNDKRTAENGSIPFTSTITSFFGNDARANEPLSSLNLGTVYVLTTRSTCSASEAFISGLRGVGVQVVTVGGTTCGKPYGFSQRNNCTLAYFALEFQGQNALGFVVPTTGLTQTCTVSDDFDHALGDPSERMLSGALSYQATASCPAISFAQPSLATQLASPTTSAAPIGGAMRRGLLNADIGLSIRPAQSNKLYRSLP